MKAQALAKEIIKVDVAFYDDNEEQKLLAYPTGKVMEALVVEPLEIPKAEFLTYFLFHHIKVGKEGYRDYDSVAKKIRIWLPAIGEYIDHNGSIRTPPGATQQLIEVSEHVGEAIGLAVMNRIHDLTEADWAQIPEQKGRKANPSFDFQIASDGENFVQVETKGSSVKDNRELNDAVKAQKRRIEEKKNALTILANDGKDLYPAKLRYGTITVIDARKDGNVRCLLTDPPSEKLGEDPQRFRLIQRMKFLRDWIAFLSPRSAFAAALATRVADLMLLDDPFVLTGVPLQHGNTEKFKVKPFGSMNWRHSTFMASKSRVTDSPAGGVVVQLSERELFLLGIREDLLVIAANQNFQRLLEYEAEVGSAQKTVDCTFSQGRYEKLTLPLSVTQNATKLGGYMHFKLDGVLNYSREGLVFGLLPLPEK